MTPRSWREIRYGESSGFVPGNGNVNGEPRRSGWRRRYTNREPVIDRGLRMDDILRIRIMWHESPVVAIFRRPVSLMRLLEGLSRPEDSPSLKRETFTLRMYLESGF